MDEKKGRRKLEQLGMQKIGTIGILLKQKIGTIGILLKAKEMDYIKMLRPELAQLREQGFSISQRVIDAVLEQAHEK